MRSRDASIHRSSVDSTTSNRAFAVLAHNGTESRSVGERW
jgi:hypothetical protein